MSSANTITDITTTCICPRCRYDLRGTVSTWGDVCPIEGRCNECGLEFEWVQVMRPNRLAPMWCVEVEEKRSHIPLACLKTFARSFQPWQFWKQLSMENEVRWRRLMIYLMCFLAVPLLLYVTVQGAVAVNGIKQYQGVIDQTNAWNKQMIPQVEGHISNLKLRSGGYQVIMDNSVFGEWTDDDVELVVAELESHLKALNAQVSNPPKLPATWQAIVQQIFLPFLENSMISIELDDGSLVPYWTPKHVWVQVSRNRALAQLADKVALCGSIMLAAVAMLLFLPLSFLILPVTRRRCRVSWRHVVRPTIYSMFIPFVIIVVAAMLLAVDGVAGAGAPQILEDMFNIWLPAGVVLAVAGWWWCVMQCYMKIPRALFVVFVLMILVLVEVVFVIAVLSGEVRF